MTALQRKRGIVKASLAEADSLHKKVKFFFIGSVDQAGFPNIKTVLPVNRRESIKHIYFSTDYLINNDVFSAMKAGSEAAAVTLSSVGAL
ncbi:MAG: hypothetical protein LBH95_06150 [Oscillospiraceae bacterium]|nr:hypothetical protein [Oscillospiraceae bacterium]